MILFISYKILAAISYLILLKGPPLTNTPLDKHVFNINYLGFLLKVFKPTKNIKMYTSLLDNKKYQKYFCSYIYNFYK